MANEKEIVTKKGEEIKVLFTRNYSDYTNPDTHKNYRSVKVRVNFEYCGEKFKLEINEKDTRLIGYLLKVNGCPIYDVDGNVLTEDQVRKLIDGE